MLQAQLGHFFVKGFEVVKVGCPTEGPGVAERLLDSGQPGCSDRPLLKRHLGRVVEEGCGAQGLGGFGLHGFLVLFLAEAQLL